MGLKLDIMVNGQERAPIVAVAPGVENALFAATGLRIRPLPICNETFRAV